MSITTAKVTGNGAVSLTAAHARKAAARDALDQKQAALRTLQDAHQQRTIAVADATSAEESANTEDAAVAASRSKHDAEARLAFTTRRLSEAQAEVDAAVVSLAEADSAVHHAAVAIEHEAGLELLIECQQLQRRLADVRERLFAHHLALPGALSAGELHDIDVGIVHGSADLGISLPTIPQMLGASPIRTNLAASRQRIFDHADHWRKKVAELEADSSDAGAR